MGFAVERRLSEAEGWNETDGTRVPRTQLGIRAALRSEEVRAIIADVVATDCGAAPRRSHRHSIAWKAYRMGFTFLAESLEAWQRVARRDERAPDLRVFAFIAANRACWAVLEGNEAKRARLRSQLRCIFGGTPGFALWRSSPVRGRRKPDWLVGKQEWRDARVSAVPLSLETVAEWSVPGWASAATFDEVRWAVLDLVGRNSGPVAVEALVAVLGREHGDRAADTRRGDVDDRPSGGPSRIVGRTSVVRSRRTLRRR